MCESLTKIHLKAKEERLRDALHYLGNLVEDAWYRVDQIPNDIAQEVIEILTTGRVGYFKVEFDEEWTSFRLVDGITRLKNH